MKKLLFLTVCCLCLCGCENNSSNLSDDLHKEEQKQLKSVNNNFMYICSKYNINSGYNSVTLNIENEKLSSKKVSHTYTCSNSDNTTLSCMTIEDFEKDCVFNETETCTLEKTFDDKVINISITNLNNGKYMIMTETTTYDNVHENYKNIITQYEKENYDCKIDTN